MRRAIGLLRGPPGHPVHPPLTDAAIGTFTLGTILVCASWLGLAESSTVKGGVLALALGLALALPAIVAGFVDYLDIARGTARWRTATFHWLAMVNATGVFLVAASLLHDDYDTGKAGAAGALCAVAGELLLLLGGWLGGTLVFVHGVRVARRPS